MIIPPSIPVVLYAVVAQESVGQLFLGGAIPGLMIGVFQLGMVSVMARRYGYPKEDVRPKLGEIAKETVLSSYVLLMPVIIVGIVVLGIATPTESSAIGVLYAAIIGFAFTRRLKFPASVAVRQPDGDDQLEDHGHHRAVAALHLCARDREDPGGDDRATWSVSISGRPGSCWSSPSSFS